MGLTAAFIICIILLGTLLLAGVSRRSSDEASFFDRVSTKEFRGFLAVFIMFHQTVVILRYAGIDTGALEFFYYYGILAVAFFFFCSG
ncbi:MAG: hypothetical protein J6L84_05520, partial [Clostridiales bacterium]|nr:hypothetical protein [Clostridiales bacterium]